MGLTLDDTLGQTIPPNTAHAVSVSLPTWRSNVGYEEGEDWVISKMQTGYPRFFIHKSIERLAESIVKLYGSPDQEKALLMPTQRCSLRCRTFIEQQNLSVEPGRIRILNLIPNPEKAASLTANTILPQLSAVVYPKEFWPSAKTFWQHTGEGIQSRRAEFCQRALDEGFLIEQNSLSTQRLTKGPRRYQRATSTDMTTANGNSDNARQYEATDSRDGSFDSAQFVEERFGRNLNSSFAAQAKLAIRRRIAGSLTANIDLPLSLLEPVDRAHERTRDLPEFSVNDVYLFSCGMNAIFTAHRMLLVARGGLKSIMFGFPYVDTLKILEKFGPGAQFYGHGDSHDIDDLEGRLQSGERFLSLFCEFPGNPLLKTPDIRRLRYLADRYGFAIVIDETIGNFLNVHVLPYADVVVSSLTKIFSGDSNVMGGTMVLNPRSHHYSGLKNMLASEYEDNQFEEDSVYLERNSRDFITRIQRVNHNAEAIVDVLRACPRVKNVNYPKHSSTQPFYDACRLPGGGYGGLVSATFYSIKDAETFYDNLNCDKGPSLGTNFTLASPFVLLAHYAELDWAAQYGCEMSLVRFSVGLEDTRDLVQKFEAALSSILDG